jgi:hypothetical protein
MKWIAKSSLGALSISASCSTADVKSRLKKVQGKKKRDSAAKMAEEVRQDKSLMIEDSIPEDEDMSANLLSTKDEDVIF